jgi:hypothetical protein
LFAIELEWFNCNVFKAVLVILIQVDGLPIVIIIYMLQVALWQCMENSTVSAGNVAQRAFHGYRFYLKLCKL